jgi:hypothetical protein
MDITNSRRKMRREEIVRFFSAALEQLGWAGLTSEPRRIANLGARVRFAVAIGMDDKDANQRMRARNIRFAEALGA